MEKLPVSIYDSNVETMLDVREGTTVRNILKKAEIALDAGDIVSPSLNTAITKDETDIIIKRCKADQQNDTETGIDGEATAAPEGQQPGGKVQDTNQDEHGESGKLPKNRKQEPKIISKEKIYDCDGSGHGYYLIKWSDGREEYEDF